MGVHSHVIIRRRPGLVSHHGIARFGQRSVYCALGKSGFSVLKHEGDGATPAPIIMRPQFAYYRADRLARPRTLLPLAAIKPSDGWCDEPTHACYNNPVQLPFRASHETMMRDDVLYDICVVLDHNRAPNGRHRFGGSAIFLHCAKPGFQATAGCIALERSVLVGLMAHLSVHTRLVVCP